MNEQWYWDLRRQVAVPESERGPDSDSMGPYPTKHDAENWKALAESRNEQWQDADEDWDEWGADEHNDAATDTPSDASTSDD